MKFRYLLLMLLCAAAMTTVSCTKEGNSFFKGYYSFKTGGTLTLERTLLDSLVVDTVKVAIPTESGQMNVLSVDDKNGTLLITMNIMGGSVYSYNAVSSGSVLAIQPAERFVSVSDQYSSTSLDVNITGMASKYDRTIVFDLSYSGSGANAVYKYKIIGSHVTCVATSNN